MATRRKLNIQQLVTLAEVYWDDSAKLAEILDDLQSRLEPEAEALYQTVSGRIHLLKTNPAAAAAQPPPTQQASADTHATPDMAAQSAPATAPASAGPRSRRRAAVIVTVLAVAGLALWLLWPKSAPPPAAGKQEAGAEIALGGEPARPESRRHPPTGSAVPPGLPRRPLLERPEITAARSDLSRGASDDSAQPPERPFAEPRADDHEVSETGAAAAGPSRAGRDDAGGARAARSARPAGGARPSRSTEAGRARSEARAGAAEAGIAIDDAQLTCYRTDSRAASCDTPPATTRGPSHDTSAEAPQPPEPASVASGPSSPAARAGGSGSSAQRGSPPGTTAATSRNGTSPAGGGAQPGSGSGPAGSGGRGGTAGGGHGTAGAGGSGAAGATNPAAATKPKPTPSEAQRAVAALPPNCPPARAGGRVVFILDGSVSMGLPLDVDADLEDELDEGIRRHDPEARREYRALLAEPGPKRITRAREAFAAAAADLPPKVDLGLVVFQECRDIRKIGVFEAAARGKAVDYIRALAPKGRTPIADSLRRAAEMLGNGASSIVLLTDGREFCGGDPCAAAAEIKAAHPRTPVSIVDITGEARAECVADITGGRSYRPDAADDLAQVVSAAFRGADPLCAATAEPQDVAPRGHAVP